MAENPTHQEQREPELIDSSLAAIMPREETPAPAVTRIEELDPANRSLVEALRLSFFIVKIVMAGLVLYYASTGWNTVAEQFFGLRVAFGKVQDQEALLPGGYASWPYPIGEFILIPKSVQTMELAEEFWLRIGETEKGLKFEELNRSAPRGLMPGDDGSVITADANLAHSQWRVTYSVRDPKRYIENISEPDALKIVRKAVERGIVAASAVHSLDEVVSSPDLLSEEVRRTAQQLLDRLSSGISIETVVCTSSRPPRPVWEDYQSVNQASADANRNIESARARATRTLNTVAGPAHRELMALIRQYEDALDAQPLIAPARNAGAEAILGQIQSLMSSSSAAGEVVEIIGRAERRRASIVQQAKAESQVFEAWQENYSKNPLLTTMTLWSNALRDIQSQEYQRFYVGPDTDSVEIIWSRDPRILREQKLQQNEAKKDAAEAAREAEAAGE